MAYVELRTLQRVVKGNWRQTALGPMEIRPARAVLAAALASPPPPLGHRGDVSTPLLEAILLQTYMTVGEPGLLRWRENLHQAPPHLRRYMTQIAAIALTVELAELYGWDPFTQNHRLFWYDDLKSLAPELDVMLPGGKFPDILFDTPDGWVSLESRGRGGVPPKIAPNAAQQQRLDELESWAALVTADLGYEPAWGMGWTWFSPDDARVDFFDPGIPIEFSSETKTALEKLGASVEDRFANSIQNAQSGFSLGPSSDSLRVVVAAPVFESLERVSFVGVAAASRRQNLRRERSRDDFDVVPYGRLVFFSGRAKIAADVSQTVREALAEEIESA